MRVLLTSEECGLRAAAALRVPPGSRGRPVSNQRPEPRAVVHVPEVRQFVHHHVVNDPIREMNQSPVEANTTFRTATPPARTRRRECQRRHRHTERCGKRCQPAGEMFARAFAQGLFQQAPRRGAGLQAKRQRPQPPRWRDWHPHCQTQFKFAAEKRQCAFHRAGQRLGAPACPPFIELFDHPFAVAADQRLYFGQRCPARRTDTQTAMIDRQADGAAAPRRSR